MKIAVTGADGFIGSHLVQALVEAGAHVHAMAQYNSLGSWGWLEDLTPDILAGVDVHLGDLRDPDSVDQVTAGVDVVYHLGALIAVPYSFRLPRSYTEANVLGTQNVLEAVRRSGARMVHTSTSEVYGTAQSVPITEEHPLRAQSPYAASKIAADKLVEAYVASYGVHAVTLRPFNTFGPRQSARAFIPTVIAQVLRGSPVLTLGSLSPRRDLLYVKDTAAAFVAVGTLQDAGWPGTVLNAGTGHAWTMGEVVQEIENVFDRPLEVVTDLDRVRPSDAEVLHLECDSSRLRQATGWRPSHSLAEGLELTVAWMSERAQLDLYKPDLYQL